MRVEMMLCSMTWDSPWGAIIRCRLAGRMIGLWIRSGRYQSWYLIVKGFQVVWLFKLTSEAL